MQWANRGATAHPPRHRPGNRRHCTTRKRSGSADTQESKTGWSMRTRPAGLSAAYLNKVLIVPQGKNETAVVPGFNCDHVSMRHVTYGAPHCEVQEQFLTSSLSSPEIKT